MKTIDKIKSEVNFVLSLNSELTLHSVSVNGARHRLGKSCIVHGKTLDILAEKILTTASEIHTITGEDELSIIVSSGGYYDVTYIAEFLYRGESILVHMLNGQNIEEHIMSSIRYVNKTKGE